MYRARWGNNRSWQWRPKQPCTIRVRKVFTMIYVQPLYYARLLHVDDMLQHSIPANDLPRLQSARIASLMQLLVESEAIVTEKDAALRTAQATIESLQTQLQRSTAQCRAADRHKQQVARLEEAMKGKEELLAERTRQLEALRTTRSASFFYVVHRPSQLPNRAHQQENQPRTAPSPQPRAVKKPPTVPLQEHQQLQQGGRTVSLITSTHLTTNVHSTGASTKAMQRHPVGVQGCHAPRGRAPKAAGACGGGAAAASMC